MRVLQFGPILEQRLLPCVAGLMFGCGWGVRVCLSDHDSKPCLFDENMHVRERHGRHRHSVPNAQPGEVHGLQLESFPQRIHLPGVHSLRHVVANTDPGLRAHNRHAVRRENLHVDHVHMGMEHPGSLWIMLENVWWGHPGAATHVHQDGDQDHHAEHRRGQIHGSVYGAAETAPAWGCGQPRVRHKSGCFCKARSVEIVQYASL